MDNQKQNSLVTQRYLDGSYADENPHWDMEDAPWKVKQIIRIIQMCDISPASIAEVGCGAGAILAELRHYFPNSTLYGFDIAPAAMEFWKQHVNADVEFILGDFFEKNNKKYDLLLVLDVLEHLADPFTFAEQLLNHSEYFIFHFPLDLSASSVLREEPLLYVRKKVGHIHYFTKGLALAFLTECGYEIDDWFYTGAAFSAPQRNWKTRLASLPRFVTYKIAKDFGVRLLGGETLMVLAHRAKKS